MDKEAFKQGYMHKQAFGLGGLKALAKQGGTHAAQLFSALLKLSVGAGIVLPLGAGTVAGALSSKLTSPSSNDVENLQRALIRSEKKELLESLKNKRQRALTTEESKSEREIRL